jgi:hypothetical protein
LAAAAAAVLTLSPRPINRSRPSAISEAHLRAENARFAIHPFRRSTGNTAPSMREFRKLFTCQLGLSVADRADAATSGLSDSVANACASA